MTDVMYTFPASHPDDQFWLWAGIGVAVIAGAGWWALMRAKGDTRQLDRNQRMLLAMLCYFALLLGVGMAGFSGWSMSKIDDVYINADAVQIGAEEIKIGAIRQAVIKSDRQSSFVNPQMSVSETRLLHIVRKDGKLFVLSEKNYDINGILNAIRDMGQ